MSRSTSNTENEKNAPKKNLTSFVITEMKKSEQTFIGEITGEKNSRVYQAIAASNLPAKSQVITFAAECNQLLISSAKFFNSFEFENLNAGNINAVKKNMEDFLKVFVPCALNGAELIAKTNIGSGNERSPLGKLIDETQKKHGINKDRNPFIFAVQRLPRYELLLKELQSNMPAGDPRVAQISDLSNTVKQYTTSFNAIKAIYDLTNQNKDKFSDSDYQMLKDKLLEAMPNAADMKRIIDEEVTSKVDITKGENQQLIGSINNSINRIVELSIPNQEAPGAESTIDSSIESAASSSGDDSKLTESEIDNLINDSDDMNDDMSYVIQHTEAKIDELIKNADEYAPKAKVEAPAQTPEAARDHSGDLKNAIKGYLNEKGHSTSHMKMADSLYAMLNAKPANNAVDIISKVMELKAQLDESSKLKRMVFRTGGGGLDGMLKDFLKSQPQELQQRAQLISFLENAQKDMDKMYNNGKLSLRDNQFELAAQSLRANPEYKTADAIQRIASDCTSRMNDPAADLNKADKKFLADTKRGIEKIGGSAPQAELEAKSMRRP